jgi:tetratricopeptide (TPR) repeat protein
MSSVSEASVKSALARRPRLITPQGLFVVALTVVGSLALLFPGLDFGHPRFLAHPDDLSIAYLDQVVRQRPSDRSARLLLARQEVALGKLTAAEANLHRLAESGNDAIAWRARLSLLELERASVDALPVRDPARRARQAAAIAQLRRLATGALDGGELARVADIALALESPADAAVIYERLAGENPSRRLHWARLAGRWYQAAGRLPESAAAYLTASGAAGEREDGAADALLAIDVLRAADNGAKALEVVGQALGRWPTDRRLLDRGITLALAQQDLVRAQGWGARLVAVASGDESILRRQVDIELAAGDTRAALGILLTLVDERPGDFALRRRVAEVATWTGQPRVALAAWVWLATRGASGAREKALDLGRGLFDHETVIALLEMAARRRELTLAELVELGDALESQGNPEGARAAFRRFEPMFTDVGGYWTERAALDEHVGDLEGALYSVREGRRKAPKSVEATREAELLWSLDRPEEALEAARVQAQTAAPSAVSFWKLFGDLAWSIEADADAEKGYGNVWLSGGADALVGERLAGLLGSSGRVEEAARVAAESFQKFGTSGVLLTTMEQAAEAERWEPVRLLASVSAPKRGELEEEPGYWATLGRLASHDGKPIEAVGAFARAVALAPSDAGLAEDLHAARIEAGLETEPESAEDARARAAEAASGRLTAAIERHDRKAVRSVLAADGELLTLSERIDAERELGRDDRAWELLSRAPTHSGDPDEDASIALHREEMAQDRQSGAFAGASYEDLSALGIFGQWGRAEIRRGQYAVEALAGHDRLDSVTGPLIGSIHADEAKAGLGFSMQNPVGDTRIEAGGYAFSTGLVPYAAAVQRFEPWQGLTIDLEGLYHQRPDDTAVLRAAALKDSAELDVGYRFADRYLIAAAAGATHYTDRSGAFLASGGIGRLEVSSLLRKASPLIKMRADGFIEANGLASVLPGGVAAVVPAGTPISDVMPTSYGTTGLGLTILGLTQDQDDVASGRGARACARCLRPFADLWVGWLMPAQRITFSVDGGIGYLFARRQELAASAFYRSDQGGFIGQRYAGLSLLYALRWM